MIAVGMMSGTSADGIDLAAIEVEPGSSGGVRFLAHRHLPYPASLRERVLRVASDEPLAISDVARLHAALGDAYAAAASAFVATLPRRPEVIALHGQTVAHLPAEHATLQIGDASRVARATDVPTVADFRSADVAAGGEGAPLVPFADHVLFASRAPIAVLNVGGIANLTLIPSVSPDDVIAFDTGPGNMTSDAIASRAGEAFDRDGRRARSGHVNDAALEAALRHTYFRRRAPKSTGREEFGAPFAAGIVDRVSAGGGSLDDAIATAVAVTARSIADALGRETPGGVTWSALAVAGGGARNPALMDALARAVAPLRVVRTDELGVPSEAREAIAFAILGAYRLRELPNTLPRATGARQAVRGGAVHLP
ncbi:MAG TPA: anhydro-N-acetylmuramic acid kinase [Candidatus Limnocylindria bacterium]|nr:anhydro-N-acetylmuramic acid kinase [Candidatus Limnocylindria bacterium]